jgi:hypothetical protein
MNKKIITILLLIVWLSTSNISFANNTIVEPENNWLAKKVINYIFTDKWLAKHTSLEARVEAAKAANEMSVLILKSIKDLGIAKDWKISDSDVRKLNTYMFKKYHNEMKKLHWDDDKWKETWFHKVVNNWWKMKWKIPVKRKYKKANRVADWIFHLWLFKTKNKKKILNEDWNKNVRWRLISRSLYVMFKDDLNLKHW